MMYTRFQTLTKAATETQICLLPGIRTSGTFEGGKVIFRLKANVEEYMSNRQHVYAQLQLKDVNCAVKI